jgi:hypothetical protein
VFVAQVGRDRDSGSWREGRQEREMVVCRLVPERGAEALNASSSRQLAENLEIKLMAAQVSRAEAFTQSLSLLTLMEME